MSIPGNTAKLGTTYRIQSDSTIKVVVPDWDRTYNALVSILLSQRICTQYEPKITQKKFCHFSVLSLCSYGTNDKKISIDIDFVITHRMKTLKIIIDNGP